MGVVFRAHDTKLGRDVAVKALPDAFANDPDRLARFEREAQVLASLNHANIAHIYGLEETPETQCIVMELVEGETLAEVLKRGPLPADEALRIAKQILNALEAAHEKGIVHRDLKPGNVMVFARWQRQGAGFRVGEGVRRRAHRRRSVSIADVKYGRHAGRRHSRHRRLYVARAGQGLLR
jgi:aminoglycoside phosphotransferase (APT) family kinase protein